MLARTPFRASVRIKAEAKRLNRARKDAVRDRIAEMMRAAEPTQFSLEGPCRAGIRSSLCLQGWKWADADAAANEIVSAALNISGAKRPSWQEGQPEWTQPGALPIPREWCARCGKRLPDENRMWCGEVCAKAARNERDQGRLDEEGRARRRASRSASDSKWQANQKEQECEGCGLIFRPKSRRGQRFCRIECCGIKRRSKSLKTKSAPGAAKASTLAGQCKSSVAVNAGGRARASFGPKSD